MMGDNRKTDRYLPSRPNAPGEPQQRRLAVAAILGLLGCVPGCGGTRGTPGTAKSDAAPPAGSAAPAASAWPTDPEQRLYAVWQEANRIVHGERGAYPFDAAGGQRIISALKAQPDEVRRWVAAGKLSPGEGELLIAELSDLEQRVGSFRPREMMEATCYEPTVFSPGDPSPEGLKARVPLLMKVAEEQTLHPEVLSKLVADCARDVAELEEYVGRVGGPELAETVQDARAQLQRIRERLDEPGKPASP